MRVFKVTQGWDGARLLGQCCTGIFVAWTCLGSAPAAAASISGKVVLGAGGSTPATRVKLSIAGANSTATDSGGNFVLPLPSSSRPGGRVKLDIGMPGYCVLSPFNGEVVVQAAAGEGPRVELRLLRSESPMSSVEDCLARFIANVAGRPKSAPNPEQGQEFVDLQKELQAWASRQGLQLSQEQANERLVRWISDAKADPDRDPHLLGLASYAERRFGQAQKLFTDSAQAHEERLAQDPDEEDQEREKIVRDYRLAGDAAQEALNFEAALGLYGKALVHVTRQQRPRDWADLQIRMGITQAEIGLRAPREQGAEELRKTAARFQEALQVYTRATLPQDWAAVQNNLGSATLTYALRAGGSEVPRLLSEAMAAYRLALQVYTREGQPQPWAATQHSLGRALVAQGERAKGAEGQRFLSEAVATHRLALQVRTREGMPLDWAMTQNNLGCSLLAQGRRAEGAESQRLLSEAVAAYRLALQVRTRDRLPQDWAMTQYNLAAALQSQGRRTTGPEGQRLLAEAVAAYRLTFQVYTRAQQPQDWATTQRDLGGALYELGSRAAGPEGQPLLSEAVAAYRLALQVYTHGQRPQDWAKAQYNLGLVLQEQAQRAVEPESQRLFSEALAAYRLALDAEPDDQQTHAAVSFLMQDRLFQFDQAHALMASWLQRHPEDLGSQADFAETLLTTGRFEEAARRAALLLARKDLPPSLALAMMTLEVASLKLLGQTQAAAASLRRLREKLAGLPADFQRRWDFTGVKTFLARDARVAAQRAWIVALIAAIERSDRRESLAALDALLPR